MTKNYYQYEKEGVGFYGHVKETTPERLECKIPALQQTWKTRPHHWLKQMYTDQSEGGTNPADIYDRASFGKKGMGLVNWSPEK